MTHGYLVAIERKGPLPTAKDMLRIMHQGLQAAQWYGCKVDVESMGPIDCYPEPTAEQKHQMTLPALGD